MAVKEFKNESGLKAIVCNANGRAWKFEGKLPVKVQEQIVLGTDKFRNELGEEVLYIWID